MLSHFQFNGFISPSQHGFYPGRSCVTQTASLYHEWANTLDVVNPPVIDAIFLDWEKAFDRVSHGKLIQKLHDMGICGPILQWLRSFLLGRSQRVILRGQTSEWAQVYSGVPQGSVLGPLLFNAFVFDLPIAISSQIRQYADDTVVFRAIKSDHDFRQLQYDLNSISHWCKENMMKLNSNKCKVLHITRKKNFIQHITYTIDSDPLSCTFSHKYLGITFSHDLSWSSHVSIVSNKSLQLLGFIKRFVPYNDTKILLCLFNALCRPILEYAAPVWVPYQIQHITAINKPLRRVTKLCVKGEFTDRLNFLNLPTIEQRLKFLSIIFIVKCLYNLNDFNIFDFIEINSRHLETVSFKHKFARTNAFKNSLFINFPRLWQSISPEIRMLILDGFNCFKNSFYNSMHSL